MAKKAKVVKQKPLSTAAAKAKALHGKIGKMLQEYHDLQQVVEEERIAALPKPVKFSLASLTSARKDLLPYATQLQKVFDYLETNGVVFKKVDRVKGTITGMIKNYAIMATFEIDTELFPKPTLAFKMHNCADDNPLDQAWGAFVWDTEYTIYENKLLDYIIGQAKQAGQ